MFAAAFCLAALCLAGCGDGDGDGAGVIEPKPPDPAATSDPGTGRLTAVEIDSAEAEYRVSRRICRILGPARIAYENNEAGTLDEIAQKWAQRTAVKPDWRNETYEGCLAGFAARPVTPSG